MVWIKHFDLELDRGDPNSKIRVETRFLVRTDDGSYGLSYQWNDEQTEAYLVPAEGANLEYDVSDNGVARTQDWRIPGRAQCLQCHTSVAGHALSFNTRQLNKVAQIFGDTNNQLTALEENGYFSNSVEAPSSLPRYANLDDDSVNLTERIRSYLAVNCVSCHQPGGTGLGSWDARPDVGLLSTGIINGLAGNNGGNPDNRLIVPGNPEASILLSRLSGCCGFTRMPPLASSELDQEAVDRMTEWIELLDDTQAYRSWRLENFGSDSSQEGDPSFDADTDQFSNYFEFLLESNPNEVGSSPFVQLDVSSENASLIYESLAQRSIQLEISEDLINWEPWYQGSPVEHSNQGDVQYSKIEGPIELEAARQLFFRISVLWAP